MTVAKELADLDEGDMVEGGTFMEALSDEPVVWKVVERYRPYGSMKLEAFWLGVHLGNFRVTPSGCYRVDY